MVDLALDTQLAERIMEHLTQVFIERFDRYWEAVGGCVQIINVNDDLGGEIATLISPELYRRAIKPYHKRLYRHIRASGARLFLHSDGAIYDLIPDLMDAGVEILNPIQFTCKNMQLDRLKREFGRDLVFWGGGCDTQGILPFATPSQVKDHVRDCISTLAPGGGFVFNQVHNIQPDVPPENVMAMYEAVAEYGG
jgi:uroporphyrinogen decarboxylase